MQGGEGAGGLVIVGGGLAGTCCAITAARAGLRVVLIQDRPVLGGNSSSEVRLWVLGATAHMCNNNRWAREGGVVDEVLVENMWRNPEGNPLIFDTILLEKVVEEKNIRLLLNTAVYQLEKSDGDTVSAVEAFCSQNSTTYRAEAPLFCDASGDGIVGFMAGAAFRMGAESREEFGEKFAPNKAYGELLGHSIYFYSKDVGKPVRFVPPSFALKDIQSKIPRYRHFSLGEYGCRMWWIEYGGRLDTVHETEAIKWELWRVAYGVWDYIKNSGEFPDAATHTLEWVGQIPGKRESRRFEGDTMLTQQDVVEQRSHVDAVSFGGWSIDLHPADGVYSDLPGCNQWHAKGVYQIPYRCMYSRNIRNLFLAGRIISASHVAFGSTRVMATCAHGGQAVGLAAAICKAKGLLPRDVAAGEQMQELQHDLMRAGQYIPQVRLVDGDDLARRAEITATSELRLESLPANGKTVKLEQSWGMMLPVEAGAFPKVAFKVDAARGTTLECELRISGRADNHTPEAVLRRKGISLEEGAGQEVVLAFDARIERGCYAFVCLSANPEVAVHTSSRRMTGVLAVRHRASTATSRGSTQAPAEDIGVDTFEFWTPARRPLGENLAMEIRPGLAAFGAGNLVNGLARPTCGTNVWAAAYEDAHPVVTLRWKEPQTIGRIELCFDTDFDHPMESVLMGHPEREMPFCVRSYRIRDGAGRVVHECNENHQTRNSIRLASAVKTDQLRIEMEHPSAEVPAAIFEVRCYGY